MKKELARSCVFNWIRIQTNKPKFSTEHGWTEAEVDELTRAADEVFAEIADLAAPYQSLADAAIDGEWQ
jgi:hypothetical protein